ncbi:phosphodiester glycosidase family protein [Paenibacillus sp. 1P07SE]|uniref:phosphodiester glycosidase family protein n=1 Tax=Paenibacillus sp. 1P07SE TaxID=3132209 RepID=UPI0039A422AC
MKIKHINRLALLTCAPFLGVLAWLIIFNPAVELNELPQEITAPASQVTASEYTGSLIQELDKAKEMATVTAQAIKRDTQLYEQTNKEVNALLQLASNQAGRAWHIYDRRIVRKLGYAAEEVQSEKLTAQLFHIKAQHFRGYALKVKLKSENAIDMVLGHDTFGRSETTMSAVKRYNALAGINAGGFADSRSGRYPLSTTVTNSEYVNGFEPSFADLFFVGLSEDLKLIGGKYASREQLDQENPRFGASFVPILLKNGVVQPIPEKWKTSPRRAPRTVIANYKDDQLLFLVTDGSDEYGNSGATLQELQILLSRFGVKDAYNLDGGGSSTLVFNGRVVNKPSDGNLRQLATNFLLFK